MRGTQTTELDSSAALSPISTRQVASEMKTLKQKAVCLIRSLR